MSNTDKVTEYVLKHAKTLPASKIEALASVIKALTNERKEAPNVIPEMEDFNLSDEQAPLDLSKVKKVSVDGRTHSVNIV